MAEPDYSIATKVTGAPAMNPLEVMTGLERYGLLNKENRQKQIDMDSLARYKQSRSAIDLEGATPDLRTSTLSGDRTDQEVKMKAMQSDAMATQGITDPKLRDQFWNHKLDVYQQKGWVTPEVRKSLGDRANPEILDRVIRGSMSVPDYRATTGMQTEADAAARAPYDFKQVDPNNPVMAPAVRPGGPLANGSPVGSPFNLSPGGGAGVAPGAPQPPGGASPPAPSTVVGQTVVGQTVETLPPGAPLPKGKTIAGPVDMTNAAPGSTPARTSTNPYFKEVPESHVGETPPTGRGIVQQGNDPAYVEAKREGFKKYNSEIAPAAAVAAKTQASLGTMKSELEKGVTTDRLGELKTSIAGYINALTGSPETTKKITGLNLSDQEIFNKESTRMGLLFARQTEGAREAVAAIQIALGANPSLLNSAQGNLKIVDIMDQSAKYDREMSKAANAYLEKNHHLNGFEDWWTTSHPPAAFISKAVPYQVPTTPAGKYDSSKLQNGVTYEFTAGGKPVKGMWNAETLHWDPVK